MTELGRQEIHDVEVLGLRLEMRLLDRLEMHVRVAAVPALRVHVGDAPDLQRDLPARIRR